MLPTKWDIWSLIPALRCRRLPPDRALRLDKQGIDRLACCHEQAVAFAAAETDVGAALGQHDPADHLAVWGIDCDAVLGLAARPAAPQIAVHIDPEAVAAARLGGAELAPVSGLD